MHLRGLFAALPLVLAVAACGSSHRVESTTRAAIPLPAVGEVSPLIVAARHSDGLYSIFPARAAAVACQIPHGGTPPTKAHPNADLSPGTCSTRTLHINRAREEILFTEHWSRGGRCPPPAMLVACLQRHPHGWRSHTWIVEVSQSGKVLATRSRGALPLQDYQ
jgi:hypothetical protein